MKKILYFFICILMILGMTGCQKNESKANGDNLLPSKTIKTINNTAKIVIKFNENELGAIEDEEKVAEIVNSTTSSQQHGDDFLCDGHAFDFELYDKNNKLIDTIYVWNDGKRLIPASIQKGCFYYTISTNLDLRKIIEEETGYNLHDIYKF